MIPGFVSKFLGLPIRNVSETPLKIISSVISALNPPNGTRNDCSDTNPPPELNGDRDLAPGSMLSLEKYGDSSLQPRPFLHTGLGHLPPEIREDIWKLSCTSSPEDLSTPQKVSCPAIFQVCRLMYQEAQPVYYANTLFRFTSASRLCSFLKHIGPERCKEITTIHLTGLAHQEPLYTAEEIDNECRMLSSHFPDHRAHLSAQTSAAMHDEDCGCFQDLQQCRNLKVVFLSLDVGQEFLYACGLRSLYGWSSVVLDVIDDFNWVIRIDFESESQANQDSSDEYLTKLISDPFYGTLRDIRVEIAPSARENMPVHLPTLIAKLELVEKPY